MKVQPVSTITLPVVVGSYPQKITKKVNFLVEDCSSSYNTIIEMPTLNSWKAVTSTYHLSVKFPGVRDRTSTRRLISNKKVLFSHVGYGRAHADNEH